MIQKSDGYNNWTIVDTTTIDTNEMMNEHLVFYDADLIFTKSTKNELAKSSDLAISWEIVKENISSFYVRSREKWYIVSQNKVFSTTDSGTNWDFELELPTGVVVNDISFSNSKIVLSGNEGLLYIKYE